MLDTWNAVLEVAEVKPAAGMGKCLLVLLDGLADRSFPELGWKTPLQAARTPVMDVIAARGSTGLYHPTIAGQALPSENAHFTMFGYDQAVFPGRGALEARGAGISLDPNDIALLAHFAHVEVSGGVLHLGQTRFPLDATEVATLAAAIAPVDIDGVRFTFHPTERHRGVLVMTSALPLDRHVTDSDPIKSGMPVCSIVPWAGFETNQGTTRTAATLSTFLKHARRALLDHPVNHARAARGQVPVTFMVTQRAGQATPVQPFEVLTGMRAATVASGFLYRGLCSYLGFTVIDAGVDGEMDAGVETAAKLQAAMIALHSHDFVHLHLKAPDEAAHARDPSGKRDVIEAIDAALKPVLEVMVEDPGITVVLATDHTTPSGGRLVHSGETVPVAFAGGTFRRDATRTFDEIEVARGALGSMRGHEFIHMILTATDRAKMVGLMDSPVDQSFWPGRYDPFRLD